MTYVKKKLFGVRLAMGFSVVASIPDQQIGLKSYSLGPRATGGPAPAAPTPGKKEKIQKNDKGRKKRKQGH